MASTQEERQKALNLINGILQEYKLTLTVAIQDVPEAPKEPLIEAKDEETGKEA